MSSTTSVGVASPEPKQQHAHLSGSEKILGESKHLETVLAPSTNLVYNHDDEEPELHARTYFAVAAMFLLNMVQVFALQGPPTVVSIDHETNLALYLLDVAFDHRGGSSQHSCPDMGAQRPVTRPSRHRSSYFFRVRHISSPKSSPGRPCNNLFHRCCHCAWIEQHLPAYCGPDLDRNWIRNCPFGVLHPKRDITQEMEAQ